MWTSPTRPTARVGAHQHGADHGTALDFLQMPATGLQEPDQLPRAVRRGRADTRPRWPAGPGAELEYTCGDGDKMRHGIWRAIVVDGTAYHFYLTVPDARFAASKVVFDEMVRSFHFVEPEPSVSGLAAARSGR